MIEGKANVVRVVFKGGGVPNNTFPYVLYFIIMPYEENSGKFGFGFINFATDGITSSALILGPTTFFLAILNEITKNIGKCCEAPLYTHYTVYYTF